MFYGRLILTGAFLACWREKLIENLIFLRNKKIKKRKKNDTFPVKLVMIEENRTDQVKSILPVGGKSREKASNTKWFWIRIALSPGYGNLGSDN